MARRHVAALLATVAALLAVPGTAAVAAVEPASDAATVLYDPGRMYVFKLNLPPESEKGLAESSSKYQPGTFSFAESDGTPQGVGPFSTPVNVGIRLKGSASFRPLSGKSAFKVKFAPEDPFFGLRVLTLNNMVEDSSMIRETLAYRAFRGSGVPASRTGYAYVYVNDEDFGVHLNIETIDKIALEKRFGPFDEDTQHLYEGENGADAWPDFEWSYEVDEGDDADRSDLEALAEAVNSEGPPDWPMRVASVIDLEEMTRMWAVEKYIGQWDGYAGEETSWTPNNYYLYSDPTGKFQMFPWGNDESWQEEYHLAFDGRAGRMFDRCLDDKACLAVYRQSVSAVRKAIAGLGLDPLATQSAELLAPWKAMEEAESTREESDCEEFQDGVAETRAFVASRDAEAAQWLGEPMGEPAGLGPELDLCVEPLAGGSIGGSFGADKQDTFPSPRLRAGRAWVVGGVLQARLWLSSIGYTTLRGVVRIDGRAVGICRDQRRVKRPRGLILRCRLPSFVRERLSRRWLGIALTTRFHPDVGSPETVTRRVILPRAS